MPAHIGQFFSPPGYSDYVQAQKAKLLHYMLIASLVISLLSGIGNFINSWFIETFFLFLVFILCLVALWLNHQSYYTTAAIVLCATFFAALFLLMYYGTGLDDASVIMYPAFILCVTFLFGKKRALLLSTLFSILSIVAMYWLELLGIHVTSSPASLYRIILISILYLSIALIIWVIRDTWEANLNRLAESYDLTLEGWAKALEFRDGDTAGHSQQVADLAVALALRLGLRGNAITQIRRGAILHDIGKIGIPDAILRKSGPLDEAEWELMRKHPVLAADMISKIPFLQTAVDIPYAHHERWDGAGYPEGRKGEQIPLHARIFALADQWNALTSDRPYRKAWPREQAIAYIRDNAGKIYDPSIVDEFLKMV